MYGQLKTIGASPKQLHRLMVKQADFLNLIGIPIGLICGFFLGKGLLPIVMQTTIYTDVGEIQPRVRGFVASALFSFFTVRISCRRPIKMMAKMSPIQALRYQGKEGGKRSSARGRDSRHRILKMAFSGLGENKGKTFFVVLSLSLSIVILNSVLNFTDCFDKKTFIKGQSGADFIVSNIEYESRSESEMQVVPREFIREAEKRTDTLKAGCVYSYLPSDEEMESMLAGGGNYDGIVTAKVQTVNGKPYDREMEMGKMLFGFDGDVWKRCKVVRGQLDMEKLKTGKYVVESIDFINNGKDYNSDCFSLKPGDKVKAVLGEKTLEYEVLANVVVPTQILAAASWGEAGILSLILASVLSFTAVKGLCSMEWFCVYRFSLDPAFALIPVYVAVSAGLAFVIDKLWNNGSVVEKLRISK